MRATKLGAAFPLVVLIFLSVASWSQLNDPNRSTGAPGHISNGTTIDSVDMSSGNLRISIPLLQLPGRGLNTDFVLTYNSKVWMTTEIPPNQWQGPSWLTGLEAEGMPNADSAEMYAPGWSVGIPRMGRWGESQYICDNPDPIDSTLCFNGRNYWNFTDSEGTKMVFADIDGNLSTFDPVRGWWTFDGTYTKTSNGSGTSIYYKDGVNLSFAGSWPNTTATLKDTNGNYIVCAETTCTDTLGRTFTFNYFSPDGTVAKRRLQSITYQDSSGITRAITFTYQTLVVFLPAAPGCSAATNCQSPLPHLTAITLPDGRAYQFEYAMNGDGTTTGELSKLTLPTGGYLRYTYTWPTQCDWPCNPFYGQTRVVAARSISDDGTPVTEKTWTYTFQVTGPDAGIATVRDPLQNLERHIRNGDTTIEYKDPADVLLKTVRRVQGCDSSSYRDPDPFNPAPCQNSRVLKIRTLMHASNLQSAEEYTYGAFANPATKKDYDWGSSTFIDTNSPPPGPLVRTTTFGYLHNPNSAYAADNIHILDRVIDRIVTDPAGNWNAATHVNYDNGTNLIASLPGAPSHDGRGTGYLSRGNPTQVQQWRNTDGAWLTTNNVYDVLGNLRSTTDPGGHPMTLSYDDNWLGNKDCIPAGNNTQAYATLVTNALGQQAMTRYFYCTGLPREKRDANDIAGNRGGTYFTYDLLNRTTQIDFPDGGQTKFAFGGTTVVRTDTLLNLGGTGDPGACVGDRWTSSWTEVDGLGRLRRTARCNGRAAPNLVDQVDICYDQLGRKSFVSHHFLSPGFSDSYICVNSPQRRGDSFAYDALSRPVQTTHADGNTVVTQYPAANQTIVIDETGRKRKNQTDALGRLIKVWEPDVAGNFIYETAYQYDVLDNLLRVDQKGNDANSANWRTRTFSYNSLSQVISATNPESGTATYQWNNDGNLITKTDARGTTTNYSPADSPIDALHRMTKKTYSDGTPTRFYQYDQATQWGTTLENPIGRLTHAGSQAPKSEQIFSYDPVGRIKLQKDCVPSNCGTGSYATSATYNLAGSLTSITYPSGRKITYNYNGANRLTAAMFDSFNGQTINYQYLAVASYHTNGAPNISNFGNGITESVPLNTRLQPSQFTLTSSVQTWMDYAYSFVDASGKNNGNVIRIADQLNANRTQTFDYDQLNRLKSADEVERWGLSFVYDPWGNLLQQNQTRGSVPTLSVAVNPKNQMLGNGYDTGGNLTSDGAHTYQYNAESNIKSVDTTGATYAYGHDGQRVRKDVGTNITEYFRFAGNTIAERYSNGDWSDYIFAGSKRVARGDTYQDSVQIKGTNTTASAFSIFDFANAGGLSNYVIQSGDKLILRQYQVGNSRGGIRLKFTDGTNTNWNTVDQDGKQLNNDNTVSTWHHRRADLSAYAGKTVNGVSLISENTTGAIAWELSFTDIVLVSANGTVRPIYNRQKTVSMTASGSSGVTGRTYQVNHLSNRGQLPDSTTNYYHGDHLGTSRMMTSVNGYPVWQATYLPYGHEYNAMIGMNNYKFTGKERDGETGLDYFGARHYGSGFGRFTSPDPLLNSGRPWLPQSWNRYTYTLNNPLRYTDPTGLYEFGCLAAPGATARCPSEAEKKRFRDALQKLKDAAVALPKGSKEREKLEKIIKRIGEEGKGGPTIKIGDAGQDRNGNKYLGGVFGNTITLNFDAIDSYAGKVSKGLQHNSEQTENFSDATDAGVLGHEGAHLGMRFPLLTHATTHGERKALYAESATYQGLRFSEPILELWCESWSEVDTKTREEYRQGSIQRELDRQEKLREKK